MEGVRDPEDCRGFQQDLLKRIKDLKENLEAATYLKLGREKYKEFQDKIDENILTISRLDKTIDDLNEEINGYDKGETE